MEGTVTGEHGIGLNLRDMLQYELGEDAVDMMRKVCFLRFLQIQFLTCLRSNSLWIRCAYSTVIKSLAWSVISDCSKPIGGKWHFNSLLHLTVSNSYWCWGTH